MTPYLSLVLACYNEQAILESSFIEIRETLERFGRPFEILFVDDASRDRTRELIRKIVTNNPDVDLRVILHDTNCGRGATVADGFRAARGEIAGYLDVDLEVHCRHLACVVGTIEQGADVATVRRRHSLRARRLGRYVMSLGYAWLVRELLAVPLRDPESGFKFFRREKLMPVLDTIQASGWFWDTEFMVRAWRRGLIIREIPGDYIRRPDKISTVRPVRDACESFVRLWLFRRQLQRGDR